MDLAFVSPQSDGARATKSSTFSAPLIAAATSSKSLAIELRLSREVDVSASSEYGMTSDRDWSAAKHRSRKGRRMPNESSSFVVDGLKDDRAASISAIEMRS